MDTFLGSLVQLCCGEGGTLQTNNSGMRSQCLRHWACPCSWHVCPPCPHCSGSRLLRRELSKAGPGLHAPPRSKPLRFRHSGSTQVQTLLGLHFLPFPGPRSSGDEVFGEHGCCNLSPPPVPAAHCSRCTTGAPSQADVDHPEPQEVLVSKEACLRFGR